MVEDLRFSGLSTVSKLARRAAKVSISEPIAAIPQESRTIPGMVSTSWRRTRKLVSLARLMRTVWSVYFGCYANAPARDVV